MSNVIATEVINDSIIGRPARDAASWLSLHSNLSHSTVRDIERASAARKRHSHLIAAQVKRLRLQVVGR